MSPGAFPDAAGHTISMYSLSKAYGFAGWRIGYMVYPEQLASAMMKSQDTILICPHDCVAGGAAVGALAVGRAYCEPHVRELASIRDIVVSKLSALAPLATVPAADGAFYCLLRVNTAEDPMALCERLIREHKVAVIPGTAFGMTEGCYVPGRVRRAAEGDRGGRCRAPRLGAPRHPVQSLALKGRGASAASHVRGWHPDRTPSFPGPRAESSTITAAE